MKQSTISKQQRQLRAIGHVLQLSATSAQRRGTWRPQTASRSSCCKVLVYYSHVCTLVQPSSTTEAACQWVHASATNKRQPTMSGATWDSTRKHARALESRIEAKLTAYSGVASQISANSGGSSSRDGASSPRNRDIMSLEEEGIGGYKLMEEEIEELLDKVSCRLFFTSIRQA